MIGDLLDNQERCIANLYHNRRVREKHAKSGPPSRKETTLSGGMAESNIVSRDSSATVAQLDAKRKAAGTVKEKRQEKNNDALAARTCDVLKHAIWGCGIKAGQPAVWQKRPFEANASCRTFADSAIR